MPDRHAPRPYRSLAIAATAGLLALVVGAGAVSAAATTTRVSISTQGVDGDDDARTTWPPRRTGATWPS